MPLQTIEPRRLYRQIADQLRVLIEQSEFAVGTRLPPERDLAKQLGVSRPSVREALIALEVEGLVEVRMGSGVYVRSADGHAARQVTAEGPLEIIRARQLIEAELAAHAARHMKKPQIAGLREAVHLMEEEAGTGHTPTQGDRLFHTRIAEASNNSVLLRVVSELFDERRNPLFEQLGTHFETAKSWAAAIAEHRQVVDAIATRQPQAAREAMSTHLSNSHDRFTANWPTTATAAAPAPGEAPAMAARKPAAKTFA
jgi:GntR family transcriptional regulator, transcriptional repressor for pyruvate dehydrogenase complex